MNSARLYSSPQCAQQWLPQCKFKSHVQQWLARGYKQLQTCKTPGLGLAKYRNRANAFEFWQNSSGRQCISQNTHDISYGERSTNPDKGVMWRTEESSAPIFCLAEEDSRRNGRWNFFPPSCTSRGKRLVRAQASYRISSSQDRQKTKADLDYSGLKKSTAWSLPWTLW